MKTLLSLVFLLLVHHSFSIASFQNKNYTSSFKPKYSYVVESDLSAEEFSEIFCERLSTKYNWHKVSTITGDDETYTSILSFESGVSSWLCEVKIKKIKDETNKILVEMIMDPYSDDS